MERDPRSLDAETLISAYCQGYFPMPEPETEEIRWYRPDPRATIPLDGFRVSRSLRRRMRQLDYRVTFSKAFPEVMAACADRDETWINREFVRAYTELHILGLAESVEVWIGADLAAGVYGVRVRGAFFAESMFHRQTDCSKIALFHLVERLRSTGFELLECQFLTDHLMSLGAIAIPDREYLVRLQAALAIDAPFKRES